MSNDVLVLGAGFAGINAALGLSKNGFDVTLVDMNEYHEFTPGVIDLFPGKVSEAGIRLNLEKFLDGTGVDFEQELVEGINPEKSVVHTGKGDYHYNHLVISLGGDIKNNGIDVSKAYEVYNLEGVTRFLENLDDGDEVLVVGSGYTGIETASELMEQGIDVTVVDKSTRPMPDSPEKASYIVLDYMNENGIRFRGGKKVVEVNEDGVVTEKGDEINADKVIWAGGVLPSKVVCDSFNVERGVPVNRGLCSEDYENVFAAGDCADNGVLNTAQNAERQGQLVAENIMKGKGEDLEEFKPGSLLVISLGRTGMMLYGNHVIKNRFFRYLKGLIRIKYFTDLKIQKLKCRAKRIL